MVSCQLDPFNSVVTPESSDVEILRLEVEDYLRRQLTASCADFVLLLALLALLESHTALYAAVNVGVFTLDIPSISSNSSAVFNISIPGAVLGMHIISWAPLTDATSLDDLLVQFMIVEDDFVRIVVSNPSAGAVDPASIDFQFQFGFATREFVTEGITV